MQNILKMKCNSVMNLISHSEWFEKHARVKEFCKIFAILVLKIVTGNKGIKKRIGSIGGIFRFDYTFAFSDFQSWGAGHNDGFKTLLMVCKGKKVVFDIGSHIGLCSMPISKIIEGCGIVYAFEPSKTNLYYFFKNIQYNGINNIKLLPLLVGDETKISVPFYESHQITGMNSIVSYKNDSTYKITYKKQVSLDDFCTDNRIYPEVIKIDVEGAEIKVLKGAKNVLKNYRPIIILSAHPKHLDLLGESVENLRNLISCLGYKILDMDRQIVSDIGLREYLLEPM